MPADVVLETDPEHAQGHCRAAQEAPEHEHGAEVARRHHAVDDEADQKDEERGLGDGVDGVAHLRDDHPHQRHAAKALEGFRAVLVEAPLLFVAAQALHRQHVVHAFFDGAGGDRAGGPRRLAAPPHDARKEARKNGVGGEHGQRDPEDLRHRRIGRQHGHQRPQVEERGHDRRVRDLVEDLLHLRRVVHHPVHRVADALVLQLRHGEGADAAEQLRPQRVVEGLGEPRVQLELHVAPESAEGAVAAVDLVLRLRGVVVALRKAGLHFVAVAGDVAAEQEHARQAHHRQPEQHFQRRHAGHGVQHRLPIGRVVGGLGHRPAENDVVHQHLRRPGQDGELDHVRRQLQHELAEIAPEEEADVGGAAQDDADGIALADLRARVDAARPLVQRTAFVRAGCAGRRWAARRLECAFSHVPLQCAPLRTCRSSCAPRRRMRGSARPRAASGHRGRRSRRSARGPGTGCCRRAESSRCGG